jgi:hypothetical protein
VIANGTLSEPNRPRFRGTFSGRLMHAAEYKSPDVFEDRRVLIVGAGNSGCDIVVDAVHRARFVGLSVRRGYHFVPKYVFGRPADTVGGRIKLPFALKQRLDTMLLKCFTGDPQRFGFPKPDHDLYESHPIVNSLVLHHIGHGDITVFKDIARLDGDAVVFRDGTRQTFDLILTATGYKLHYPFIDKRYLNWQGAAPHFYLNAFHPEYDNLFIAGLVEAAGLGWEGRNEQAELIARYIHGIERNQAAAVAFQNLKRAPFPDMRGGVNYLKLDRMAYYVHKDTYRATVGRHIRECMTEGHLENLTLQNPAGDSGRDMSAGPLQRSSERLDAVRALKSGGGVLMIRHANAPGSGDPANFKIDDCATQRNLDERGRAQARAIGEVLRHHGIAKVRLYSSQWCRCLETARLMNLGDVQPLPALNSFFGRPDDRERAHRCPQSLPGQTAP